MAVYELMYLLKTNTTEEKQTELKTKMADFITNSGGKILKFEKIGTRAIATVFEKQTHGVYYICNYESDGKCNKEFERLSQITEEIIRYVVFKLDKRSIVAMEAGNALVEKLKATAKV